MLKLVVAVLAGATIVAAQMPQAPVTTDGGQGSMMTKGEFGGFGMHGPDSGKADFHAPDSGRMGGMFGERDSAFAEKMKEAMDRCGSKADSAREYAHKTRGEIEGKTGEDSAKVMARHDSTTHVRMQGAIDALERNSTRMGSQVRESQERNAARMQERRDEMIQLQKKILERKAAQEAEKPATTDAPAAQ